MKLSFKWGHLLLCMLSLLFILDHHGPSDTYTTATPIAESHIDQSPEPISQVTTLKPPPRSIETLCGPVQIETPLLADLIESPIMQRLKEIDPYGPSRFFSKRPILSQYDHSLGVYALLKKCDPTQFEKQLAGLLENASRTAFSHLEDLSFNSKEQAFQSDTHTWYLEKMKINDILTPYRIELRTIHPKYNDFIGLSATLPDLSPDCIMDNLQAGLFLKFITREELTGLVNDLHFERGQWFFTDEKHARKLGELSLYLTEQFWDAPASLAVNHWTSQLLERGLKLNIISVNDIHFDDDNTILMKLYASKDSVVQKLIYCCENDKEFFEVVTEGPFDIEKNPKFRGLDPYIQKMGRLQRLTGVDLAYNREYLRVKEKMARGIKLRFKDVHSSEEK